MTVENDLINVYNIKTFCFPGANYCKKEWPMNNKSMSQYLGNIMSIFIMTECGLKFSEMPEIAL